MRRYRIAACLTQQELAEQAGISVRGLSDLERGTHLVPHRDTLLRIADALRLETDARTALETAARQQRAVHATAMPHARRNLPAVPTSFVGRDRELADVSRWLETARLLTVTGAGGVGKTRLSIELARNVPGEVLFVDLVSLTEGAQVASTVASTMGILEQPGRSSIEALATALRDKALLLILDNCEHLVAACADLAKTLIRSCPHLRVLATSREALGIDGELVWTLSPLSLPDLQRSAGSKHFSESEAVRLFVARAQLAQPDFVLDQHSAPPVMEVCVRLDGIPLAIELAAARVRALGIQQLARWLADSNGLLTINPRGVPGRHQTLRAALAWSYQLLTPAEQQLFKRLTIFAGGWTPEAAGAICWGDGNEPGELVDLHSRLVEKSLVVAHPSPAGTMRYRFLEPVREYAKDLAEKQERAELQERHLNWYVELGEQALRDYWSDSIVARG